LNTVLESLAEGVPLVAIPLGNDQPGVAARVAARGAGLVIPRPRLNARRLRRAVERVLHEPQFRRAAMRLREAMQRVDGPEKAADVIESVLLTKAARIVEDAPEDCRSIHAEPALEPES
jgi:UDP:flavonoid glycosyltransferase YjiC (YdhE family)